MGGIRAAAVGDEVVADPARAGVEQEEAVHVRRAAEIGDADDVGVAEPRAMPVEGGAGAGEQARVDHPVDGDPRLGGDRARMHLDRRQRLRRRILQPGDDLGERLALGRRGEKSGRSSGPKQLPA
jgi:hypothetical protein